MAACNLGCEQLRLVDRCVECNPRYGDRRADLAYEIYSATRWGGGSASLEEAEQAAVKRGRKGRWS